MRPRENALRDANALHDSFRGVPPPNAKTLRKDTPLSSQPTRHVRQRSTSLTEEVRRTTHVPVTDGAETETPGTCETTLHHGS